MASCIAPVSHDACCTISHKSSVLGQCVRLRLNLFVPVNIVVRDMKCLEVVMCYGLVLISSNDCTGQSHTKWNYIIFLSLNADLSATREGVSQITRNGEQQCSQTLTGQSLQSPAPIRIRTNTNDGQGYFDINLSPNASLSIHESSTNLDFGLLKRLFAYTTGGTSCNIQFTVRKC